MDNKTLIYLIQKDITELQQLTRGFGELDMLPTILIELATDKAQRIVDNLVALKNDKAPFYHVDPVTPEPVPQPVAESDASAPAVESVSAESPVPADSETDSQGVQQEGDESVAETEVPAADGGLTEELAVVPMADGGLTEELAVEPVADGGLTEEPAVEPVAEEPEEAPVEYEPAQPAAEQEAEVAEESVVSVLEEEITVDIPDIPIDEADVPGEQQEQPAVPAEQAVEQPAAEAVDPVVTEPPIDEPAVAAVADEVPESVPEDIDDEDDVWMAIEADDFEHADDDVVETDDFTMQDDEPEDVSTISQNIGGEHRDPVQDTPPTLFELLSKPSETRNDALMHQHVDDIKKAMSIGDSFFFQRELFGGNGELMFKTIKMLNKCNSLREAEKYVRRKFDWDMEGETAQRFMQIVARRFV
ncbi:MAG: hypothetical protein IJ680_09085 [Paludibacteraceae bacterium]|nr:hypothetical protein [Paludibacteraceae bacterium]